MSDHTSQPAGPAEEYAPPRLEVLGSVHELTLRDKAFGTSDGDWFSGQGLMTIS
jgi:hypothetical protein